MFLFSWHMVSAGKHDVERHVTGLSWAIIAATSLVYSLSSVPVIICSPYTRYFVAHTETFHSKLKVTKIVRAEKYVENHHEECYSCESGFKSPNHRQSYFQNPSRFTGLENCIRRSYPEVSHTPMT